MARRMRLSRGRSRRAFGRGTRVSRRNMRRRPMRGGLRI